MKEEFEPPPVGDYIVVIKAFEPCGTFDSQKTGIWFRIRVDYELGDQIYKFWLFGRGDMYFMMKDTKEWWLGRSVKIRIKAETWDGMTRYRTDYRGLA